MHTFLRSFNTFTHISSTLLLQNIAAVLKKYQSLLPVSTPACVFTLKFLVLIYVNDISSNISSTLRMFADNTKVYRELSNIAKDSEALQLDVDQLLSWHLNGNYALIPISAKSCVLPWCQKPKFDLNCVNLLISIYSVPD